MKTKKVIFSLATLLVFTLLFWGSATIRKAKTPLVVPDYSYSPPSPAEPGSAGIRIALFQPAYTGNFTYSSVSPFNQFRGNMGKDLEQILTARGYIIKGPYDEYDLMTYSDKTECEYGLFADIDLNITKTSGGWRYYPRNSFGGDYSNFKGTVTLSGKITLYISETFTRQKLIVRSLSIPQQINIPVEAEGSYRGSMSPNQIPIDDPGVHNPIANALVDFYKSTMDRAWHLMVKDDLVRVKDQIIQIRKESGFIKQ